MATNVFCPSQALAWFTVSLHMLLWFIKWGREGTLGHNMVTFSHLKISPHNIHYDNFTIPLCEIAWMGTTVMLAIALLGRRKNYELFYYAHHWAIVFLAVALLHAWSFW